MIELAVASLESELAGALALGPRALAWTEAHGVPLLASASFSAQALVLGALQREASLRSRSPARFDLPLAHRFTTGTEAQLEGAVLYHALALPRVDALFSDARARTLLNRNLRALLRGYAAAGVPFRYFGTEVLALLGQPVALVGYDQVASGAVLVEVLIGLENPCVVRSALKREPPASLYAVLRARPEPHDLLLRAVRGTVERLGASAVDVAAALCGSAAALAEPLPAAPVSAVPIPLGVVEATLQPVPRLSGDLLASRHALGQVEARAAEALQAGRPLDQAILDPLQGAPLDGARPVDVLNALCAAAGS